MARFRATIQGQRGEVSRLGSSKSGITARVNGWNAGIRVEAESNGGKDVFRVYYTGGSHEYILPQLLGTLTEEPYGPSWTEANA